MARGFGDTYGTASTDNYITVVDPSPGFSARSWFIWVYRNGNGEGDFGRIWCNSDPFTNGAGAMLCADGFASGNYGFYASNGPSEFYFAEPTISTWASIGVYYDGSNAANDPIVYRNGSKLTVGSGLTEQTAPGAAMTVTTTEDIILGNRSDGGRDWDGMLAEFACWNTQLTDDEFGALADRYSPRLIRPESRLVYVPMVRDNIAIKGSTPTLSNTAIHPHPPIIMPRSRGR